MSLAETARLTLTLLVLGLAASVVVALIVQDEVPLGWLRRIVVRRWPPEHWQAPAPLDPLAPPDPTTVNYERHGSKIGTLITCPRCMGVWVSVAFFFAWWAWPVGTMYVALPFAVAAVQRFVNSRT